MNTLPIQAQTPLPPRREAFAQLLSQGRSAAEAYREAGYHPAFSETSGPRLARTESIRGRLAFLQGETAELVKISKAEVVESLSLILLSPPREASADNPLCEVRLSKAGPCYVFPGKLAAAKLLGRFCGWETKDPETSAAQEEVFQELAEFVASIRRRPPESSVPA